MGVGECVRLGASERVTAFDEPAPDIHQFQISLDSAQEAVSAANTIPDARRTDDSLSLMATSSPQSGSDQKTCRGEPIQHRPWSYASVSASLRMPFAHLTPVKMFPVQRRDRHPWKSNPNYRLIMLISRSARRLAIVNVIIRHELTLHGEVDPCGCGIPRPSSSGLCRLRFHRRKTWTIPGRPLMWHEKPVLCSGCPSSTPLRTASSQQIH